MYFACDFETTGLLFPSAAALEKQPHIVQFAYQILDKNFRVIGHRTGLINPGVDIPAEATNVHKITNELVDSASPFSDFADIFLAEMEGRIWIGQNAPFDLGVLYHELRRLGKELPEVHTLDLMDYIVLRWGKRRKLGDVYFDLFGEKMAGAHDALADITATVKCLVRMREDLC